MENEIKTPEPAPAPAGPPVDKETRQANTFGMLCFQLWSVLVTPGLTCHFMISVVS